VARAELRGYDDPLARERHRELSADCGHKLVEQSNKSQGGEPDGIFA
jgi:hypothetical protein